MFNSSLLYLSRIFIIRSSIVSSEDKSKLRINSSLLSFNIYIRSIIKPRLIPVNSIFSWKFKKSKTVKIFSFSNLSVLSIENVSPSFRDIRTYCSANIALWFIIELWLIKELLFGSTSCSSCIIPDSLWIISFFSSILVFSSVFLSKLFKSSSLFNSSFSFSFSFLFSSSFSFIRLLFSFISSFISLLLIIASSFIFAEISLLMLFIKFSLSFFNFWFS